EIRIGLGQHALDGRRDEGALVVGGRDEGDARQALRARVLADGTEVDRAGGILPQLIEPRAQHLPGRPVERSFDSIPCPTQRAHVKRLTCSTLSPAPGQAWPRSVSAR